jgi:hypothetical protein
MTPRNRATLIISVAALGAFFALRALPDTACGFLHLHDQPATSDGLEYCAPNEVAMFANPEEIRFPVTAELEPDTKLVAGKTSRIQLKLTGPGGKILLPHEIALSHTKPIHLMVADPTLDAYRHIHPVAEGSGGVWSFDFTPVSGGEHVFFVDCVHALTKRKQIMRVTLPVEGAPGIAAPLHGLTGETAEGVSLALTVSPVEPKVGEDIDLRLRFTGKSGAPVTLTPVMAAYAHLVAFDTERKGFAHLHPMQTGHERDASPELRFRLRADKPGRYRVWAQYDTGAGERFTPFDITVR